MFRFFSQYLHNIKMRETRYAFLKKMPSDFKVLDIGCGSGLNGRVIKSLYSKAELHGVDILPSIENSLYEAYHQVDLNDGLLPYPDSYFDAILFTHVIEHLHTPLELGSDIRRVLKNGGMIYIEAPNWTSMLVPSFGFRREQHDPFNFYDDPSHIKPSSQHGIFEYLSQFCGLEVMEIGILRNWYRIPFDIPIIIYALIFGKRGLIVASFWNIFGWCVYGLGRKV